MPCKSPAGSFTGVLGVMLFSGWPHSAGRPTLRRRLAGGGALVIGRDVAATEFSER